MKFGEMTGQYAVRTVVAAAAANPQFAAMLIIAGGRFLFELARAVNSVAIKACRNRRAATTERATPAIAVLEGAGELGGPASRPISFIPSR